MKTPNSKIRYHPLLKVAAGEMPGNVIDSDIDAEIPTEEAHKRYAAVAADYLVRVTPSVWWEVDEINAASSSLEARLVETEAFE